MKHIKTFENTSTPIITKVDFTGGGDGVYAIYIDGSLHKYGDYYHDKIEDWIQGFIDGVKWSGVNIVFNSVKCSDSEMISDISEMANVPPKYLSDVKYR